MGSAWKLLGMVTTLLGAMPALGVAYHGESRRSVLEEAPSPERHEARETGSLQLINRVADRTWVGVHLSRANVATWSENLLGEEATAPSGIATLRDVPCGEPLDIKLVSSRGSTLETRGIIVHCGETRRVALTR